MIDRRDLTRLIDRTLLGGAHTGHLALLELASEQPAAALAERVRRRAGALARRNTARRRIERRRDALVRALYARDAPAGWGCGWCDGSYAPGAAPRAGIGGLLFDPSARRIARYSRTHPASDPFTAEIAALATLVEIAARRGIRRLRAHSDCAALARMWREDRADPRLDPVRAAAAALTRFDLRAVRRLHNPTANRLARRAVQARTSV